MDDLRRRPDAHLDDYLALIKEEMGHLETLYQEVLREKEGRKEKEERKLLREPWQISRPFRNYISTLLKSPAIQRGLLAEISEGTLYNIASKTPDRTLYETVLNKYIAAVQMVPPLLRGSLTGTPERALYNVLLKGYRSGSLLPIEVKLLKALDYRYTHANSADNRYYRDRECVNVHEATPRPFRR